MPKKYQNKALLTKPTSSAPSHFSSHATSSQNVSKVERSVNDLIRESRRSQNNEQATNSQSLSSIPPSLRAVLDVPAPPPPEPRNQIRGPARLRRIPGPPPPRSWLTDSRHAPKSVVDMNEEWVNTRIQHQTSTLPGGNLPATNSLQDMILKRMALNWAWHAEYDHTYIASLPVGTRENLLSYISIYDEKHWPNPLPFLFHSESDQDELDDVLRLDLSNGIGTWATVKRIEKELTRKVPSKEVMTPTDEVPESWDTEDNFLPKPTPMMRSLRFSNLKHLSLACNPGSPNVSGPWPSLISLASQLPTLSSLSLAYWPQPTYTPHASKGRYRISNSTSSSMPTTIYGGSNFYTAFDNDWREAAGILRTLSRSLYCLRWLDLTGCGEWFPALIWQKPESDEETSKISYGPDWSGSWRNLKTIILAVGWSPGPEPDITPQVPSVDNRNTDLADVLASPTSMLNQLSLLRLGDRAEPESRQEPWDVEFERKKQYHRKEMERYMAIRESAQQVARELRSVKKSHGGTWIDFNFGNEIETVHNHRQ